MTGHLPQSEAATIEAVQLMGVRQNIVNAKNGKPDITPRQNHLLGLHMMTVEETFLTRAEFMSLVVEAFPRGSPAFERIPMPAILRPCELWTSRQLVSMLFPETLTIAEGVLSREHLNRAAAGASESRPAVLISRGTFHYGVMNAALSNTIVLALYTSAANANAACDDVIGLVPEQCARACTQYLNTAARLVERWLQEHGASLGIEDMMTDIALRTTTRMRCADCADDPTRSRVLRSCPQCRLHCKDCTAVRAQYARSGRRFVLRDDWCEMCASFTFADCCMTHLCKTLLPRCRECHELNVHSPHFSLASVPSTVANSPAWPRDVAIWLRIGPIKFDAWVAARASDEAFADVLRARQQSWRDAAPTHAQIDALERDLCGAFAHVFAAADDDRRLALPANEPAHAKALKLWQRVGPTKYRIKRRLARVERDVRAAINRQRRAYLRDHNQGKLMTVDARIDGIEVAINELCDAAKAETHALAWANLPPTSTLRRVIEAGTKGNQTNVGICVACVGKQSIDGARIVDRMFGVDGVEGSMTRMLADAGARYLPHFAKQYPGSVDGGFCDESLMEGSSPINFWFQAVASRDTIISTAVRTAPVGHMSRRLMKVGEDVLEAADGTVRNAAGAIVVQQYGAGYATQFVVSKSLPPLVMSEAQLALAVLIDYERDYCVFDPRTGERDETRSVLVWNETRMLRDALTYLRELAGAEIDTVRSVNNIQQLMFESVYSGTGSFRSTAVAALLPYASCAAPEWNSDGPRDATMLEWRASVNARQAAECRVPYDETFELLDECDAIALVGTWLTQRADCRHARCAAEHVHLENCDDVTRAELRLRLCAKQVVRRFCMNRQTLEYFMQSYAGWLRRATVTPGDAVGTIANQSFASENMQATLSSFHFAGETCVAVNEGMPRSLEVLAARSTAKMATPKVAAPLPSGGYRARRMDRLTRKLLGKSCSAQEMREYAAAWAQLGRDEHVRELAELARRPLTTTLPAVPLSSGRKRVNVQRQNEYDEALFEARQAQTVEYADMVAQTLSMCAQARRRRVGETLDTLLCEWRVVETKSPARKVLRAKTSARNPFVQHSQAYVEMLCAHAIWEAVLPLIGESRAFAVTALYDTSSSAWKGVEIAYATPVRDALSTDVDYAALCKRVDTEAEAFYRAIVDERVLLVVFCADYLRFEFLDTFKSDMLERALAALKLPQSEHARAATFETSHDGAPTAIASRNIDRELVFTHMTRLRKPLLTELLDSVEIVYAPLHAGEDGVPRLGRRPDGSALFDEEIEALYREMRDDVLGVDFGCRGCATHRGDRHYSYGDPDVRCLSSFALELRFSRQSMNNVENVYDMLIARALTAALGAEHSVMLTDLNAEHVVAHVRLHTCALDALVRRTGLTGGDADFCRPLLDARLLTDVVALPDDNNNDEPVVRARRSRTLKDDGMSERYLRRHMQRVLLGEQNKQRRRAVFNSKSERGAAEHKYDFKQTAALHAIVEARIAARTRHRVIKTASGDEFIDGSFIKELRARCGELPKCTPYEDTGLPLVEHAPGETRFGVVVETRARASYDSEPTQRRVFKTLAELIADEQIELRTQVELGELHRTLAAISQITLGGVDTQASVICAEHMSRKVVGARGGVEKQTVRGVALNSRAYLRVINQRIVERRRTTTNAIADTHQVLGKMAARNKTCAELNAVVRASHAFVDLTHLALLANVQWCKGWCMPFTVHGLKYVSDDVLQQMTFETSVSMLRDAVVRRATNAVATPSTCISLGKPIFRLGTNAIDLRLDPHALAFEDARVPFGDEEFSAAQVFAVEIQAMSGGAKNNNPFGRMPHLEAFQMLSGEASPDNANFADDVELADLAGGPPAPEPLLAGIDALYEALNPHGSHLSAVPQYDPTAPAYNGDAQPAAVEAYDPDEALRASLTAPRRLPTFSFAQQNALADDLSFLGDS